MFFYDSPDGEDTVIGSWSAPRLEQSADGTVSMAIVSTGDPAKAEHWRSELASGRLPVDIENER